MVERDPEREGGRDRVTDVEDVVRERVRDPQGYGGTSEEVTERVSAPRDHSTTIHCPAKTGKKSPMGGATISTPANFLSRREAPKNEKKELS